MRSAGKGACWRRLCARRLPDPRGWIDQEWIAYSANFLFLNVGWTYVLWCVTHCESNTGDLPLVVTQLTLMMMIAFITFKSSLVPLFEGL